MAAALLSTDGRVTVERSGETLTFRPTSAVRRSGLVFIVGGGVSAEAYAPLLRPLADDGHLVVVVRLPYRLAPLERHKQLAVDRVRAILEDAGTEQVHTWVVAGHSLGGALACRVAVAEPGNVAAIVLVGTSHPKTIDLSQLRTPITKVVASTDGIATVEMMEDTGIWCRPTPSGSPSRAATTHSSVITATSSSMGHPTSRERQQDETRAVLRRVLAAAEPDIRP